MKIGLAIMLGLTGPWALVAQGEAGPEIFGKQTLPQLPLMEDPSALLDEDLAAGPLTPTAEPFKQESKAPYDLGKPLPQPSNLPKALSVHPETAGALREQKPLVPVHRTEGSTSVALPAPSPTTVAAPTPEKPPQGQATFASPVGLPQNTGPAQTPPDNRNPANSQKVVETKISLAQPAPAQGPELAVVLSEGKFHPSRIRLRQGEQTRLLFTTIGKKPAALIIERLRVQKWLARPEEALLRTPASSNNPWEVNREVSSNRLTEIILDPVRGTYTFHDAISGAAGEIVVE